MRNFVEELTDDLEMDKTEVLRLLGIYLRTCGDDLGAINQAIDRGDAELLATHAHNIKGASANLRIEDARSAAEALEMMGRSGRVSEASMHLSKLCAALARVQTEMNAAS